MKAVKILLIFLFLIFTVPIAFADVNLYHFSSTKYNWGDLVLFNGDVTYTNDTRANLNIILKCGSSSQQIAVELLDLDTGEAKEFFRLVTMPNSLSGQCNIELNLVDLSGTLLETKVFEGFELTNDLKGNFEISKTTFQLGDELTVNGFVTRQNNAVVDGTAMVYFKQNGNTLFLDTEEIVKGSLDYSKQLTRLPTGNYQIDIIASDNFGNKHYFIDLFSITLTSTITISTSLDKNNYNPGEQLLISGYVNADSNKELSNLQLNFNFETRESTKTLFTSLDQFSSAYNILPDVKSGKHTIEITANDDEGNYGFKLVEYNVNAIPTSLDLDLQGSSFDPEQEIVFNVTLFDQADDEMQESANVYLLDQDGDVVTNRIIKTGTSDSLVIPQYAEPGLWKLKVEAFELSKEALITIKEYSHLETSLDGDNLIVNNLGNIPFKGLFEIEANDLKEGKNLKLGVGDSKVVELGDLFPPGFYQIKIPSTDQIFDDVKIDKNSFFSSFENPFGSPTGNIVKNVGEPGRLPILFFALIIVGCSIIYLIFGKRKGGRKEKVDLGKDKDYMLGRKKLDELKAKGIRKDRPVEYGKATQEDIEDWKRRVQETYKEQEKQKSTSEFLRYQQKNIEKDKPKDGLFNMFK